MSLIPSPVHVSGLTLEKNAQDALSPCHTADISLPAASDAPSDVGQQWAKQKEKKEKLRKKKKRGVKGPVCEGTARRNGHRPAKFCSCSKITAHRNQPPPTTLREGKAKESGGKTPN